MNWISLPPWSPRVIVTITVGLLAIAAVRWWREGRGSPALAVRALIVAALTIILFNPQALLPHEQTSKPRLMVLVDTSASMATRDDGKPSRLKRALKVLNNAGTLSILKRNFRLDVLQFDHGMRPATLPALASATPNGDASDIGSALMRAVSELGDASNQAGILLVSDGRATTPNALNAAQLALARSVPLWTWTLGGPVPRHDVWIETASSEALAFSGADAQLTATLHAVGYPNRSFNVDLLKDGKVVETKEVLPDTNGVARVSMQVKAPEAGEQRYVFRVAPQPEESDTANNERSVYLRSVGARVRVLIAEGQPSWDTKFLVQALEHNPHVDLTAIYRLNAARYVTVLSSTGAETRVESNLFPRTAAAMNAFDVIMLGRGADAFFDKHTEALLTDFVATRGGSLVFARGKAYGGRFQPLAKLDPLVWGNGAVSGVKLNPTEAGRDNPIFDLGPAGTLEGLLERLPAINEADATLGEKPLAVVLADSVRRNGPVLLAYQRYGLGKVLCLNADGLWHWAFRESGQKESEKAYQRFWVSTLQWLLGGNQFLPGADMSLTSARRYYTSEQPMRFLITTRDLDRSIYQPQLLIRAGTHSTEVEPRASGNTFVAEAGPFPPGTYHVTLKNNVGKPAEVSQTIEVVSASVEEQNLSADPELMRKLAEESGGAVVTTADISRMPEVVQRWEAARELTHREQSLWDRWWVLAGLVSLLGAEWWLRRREGLL